MVVVSYQTVTFAQQCPPELAQAKAKIASTQAAMKKSTAQGKEIQAPRTAAGYKGQEQQAPRGQEQQAPRGQEQQAPRGQGQQAPGGQEQQAPRGQEQQAPRGQEQQAPRGQEQQAPRGQEQQAPRGQEQQAPRKAAGARSQTAMQSNLARARKLTAESEQACKAGDMSLSAQKAKAALEALK
jgi:hypothetical protein